jgi:ferritin-like metal-binding protein YciE
MPYAVSVAAEVYNIADLRTLIAKAESLGLSQTASFSCDGGVVVTFDQEIS